MKTLNTATRKKGVLGKWVNNKFHNTITQIENTYTQNHNTLNTFDNTQAKTLNTFDNTSCVLEKDTQNTVPDSKHIENTIDNTPQNTFENPITPFENTKVLSLAKHKTSDRVKEVENFINDKFDSGEQIEIGLLKETFNLSRREWDTIRNKLNNIEVRGKKTYRLG
jgi:hypothetical protein